MANKRELKVTYVPVERLTEWNRNPRDNDEAAERLAQLIEHYGFINPIIATPNYVIRAGHTRLKAAKKAGMREVPVLFVEFESEAAAQAFSLADNKSSEWADWNLPLLKDLLLELDTGEFDVELTGFQADEIEELINRFGSDEGTEEGDFDPDAALDEIEEPITQVGDIWILGSHRIICGDSTHYEVVDTLMDGGPADMVLTDPPYNVDYEAADGRTIENDSMGNKQYVEFLTAAFSNAHRHTRPGGAIYVWHAEIAAPQNHQAMVHAGFEHHQTLVWVKNAFVLGRSDYHYQHEPVLYGWKGGSAHYWYGYRDKTTVFDDDQLDIDKMKKEELKALILELRNSLNSTVLREDKPTRSSLHPTMKPPSLLRQLIKNSTGRREVVLDLFLGSGSTLIACEQTGRICYGVELDPRYVDVIVQRYIDFRKSDQGVTLLRNGQATHYSDINR